LKSVVDVPGSIDGWYEWIFNNLMSRSPQDSCWKLKRDLLSLYLEVAKRGSGGIDPLVRHGDRIEEFTQTALTIFNLSNGSHPRTRIGIFLSLLGDRELDRWLPFGKINPELEGCVDSLFENLEKAIPNDPDLLIARIAEAVPAYMNGWRNFHEGRAPYESTPGIGNIP